MRWEALFADMRVQSAAQQQQDFEAEVAQAVDLEWSRTPLCDRFRAHIGHCVALQLAGGMPSVSLRVEVVGSDWLSGSAGTHAWLIPLKAVVSATGLSRRAQRETSPSQQRLRIAAPLRALAAAHERVVVYGEAGELVEGVLCGVGRDFIDLRCLTQRRMVRTVPIYSLTAVRSAAGVR